MHTKGPRKYCLKLVLSHYTRLGQKFPMFFYASLLDSLIMYVVCRRQIIKLLLILTEYKNKLKILSMTDKSDFQNIISFSP